MRTIGNCQGPFGSRSKARSEACSTILPQNLIIIIDIGKPRHNSGT
jgi:hypothetical protein